mmetsp:Transcript_30496/g.40570  ORF Transcript_30496/g.40570 Transcript_30496/m.40570 type:complete len:183 (+) Transcript_30496:69-617(+)
MVLPNYSSGEGDSGGSSDLLEGFSPSEKIFAWTCLMTFPVVMAAQTLLNRLLRDLHENTVSTYGNFFQIFIFLTVVLAIGEDAGFFLDFNAWLWCLMVGCSVCQVASQTFNFKAGQNLPIPARMPMNVSSIIFQSIIDALIFDVSFATVQIILLLAIVCLNGAQVIYFFFFDKTMEEQKVST